MKVFCLRTKLLSFKHFYNNNYYKRSFLNVCFAFLLIKYNVKRIIMIFLKLK